jgi:hemerythrin-like domain-containing protein
MVVIHRAIRQDLRRLAACLSETAVRSAPSSQARAIGRYTAALLDQIRAHHQNEDDIIWPMIAATAGQAVDLTPLTDDHQTIKAAASRAGQALASLGAAPDAFAELHVSVSELRDMLEEHIADEEEQIFPAMRRYLPASAYRWCQKQIQRKASPTGLRFTAPWLARYARPDELSRLLAAGGWPARIVLPATRPGYARLERRAFGANRATHDTRHVPNRTFRSPPGGTMFRSYPGQLADLARGAQRDNLDSAVRLSRHGTRPRVVSSRAGTGLSRLAAAVAAVTISLLASAAAAPAAFARETPTGLHRRSPVALTPQATIHHAAASGGITGWQIALIGIGVPAAMTAVAILIRRMKARRAASPTG